MVGVRRSEFVFAMRFGKGHGGVPDSSPGALRRTCERALASSNIGYLDLFYQELNDPQTPVERTMWELKVRCTGRKTPTLLSLSLSFTLSLPFLFLEEWKLLLVGNVSLLCPGWVSLFGSGFGLMWVWMGRN